MLLLVLLAACAKDEPEPDWVPEEIGRCADTDPLRQPFFGDTHVHTALSLDANLQGTRLRPLDAYRFAMGERVGLQPYDDAGQPLRFARLDRPLDFVVLSDHAEFLGTVTTCTDPSADGYDEPVCQLYRTDPDAAFYGLNLLLTASPDGVAWPPLCGEDGADCRDAAVAAWEEVQTAAEAVYDRTDACTFASFVGYEWSGNPGAYNLHRNVVFRNERVPELPASYFDAPTPDALWAALHADCLDPGDGCDALTIPHNSNLSGGLMFEDPPTAAVARERAAMEPLVEVFQHKGASECQPGATSADEWCGFEQLPYDNLAGANLDIPGSPQPADFVRDALGAGLVLSRDLGVNPYRYGIVASTDTHLGTPGATDEATFQGHGGAGQPNRDALPPGLPDLAAFNPGGLAVLWAEERSREALFQAMRRGEAYGTSGPRIVVRFFGGDLDAGWCDSTTQAADGYRDGVPMGGTNRSDHPSFALAAWQDPGTTDHPGTHLQRLQIVKGELRDGEVTYQTIDVAGGDVGAVGDDCVPDGAGATSLCAVWADPDFDADAPAFWYARVLEVPTCRWTAVQCVAAGVDCEAPETVTDGFEGCCDDRWPTTQQERAWTSPIWHVPG